ncbi:hypothetical protein [Ferdinandcohnia quinoae]|uniref:hypothetical protein n=1 Tax=Fredinandcohnia quinoae TaxID=2918902 RepID=UPI003D67D7C6
MKSKKKSIITGLLILFMILAIVTNPTKQEYLQFSEEQAGIPTPSSVEIEKINFGLFSTYAPKVLKDEYGIVHIGFMGKFFQVSNGQYDYPWWLDFFN